MEHSTHTKPPTGDVQLPGPHMTLAEIIAAYPDQHVILVDVDFDRERMEIRGGVVIAHSHNRKEVFATARPRLAGITHFAKYFTGRIRPPLLPLWIR